MDAFREHLQSYAYRYHVHHPFDKLLQSGRATRNMLQMWAANRYYYQDTIPRKDAAIISQCNDSNVRAIWIQHLITHDVKHALQEWLSLTRALGLRDEDVIGGKYLLPGTKFACDAYYNFCREASWQDAMCSSMTHLFAGDIHRMRIASWPERYPWLPEEAFTYFTKRTQTLPSEIDSTLELLSAHYLASPERMQRAVDILKFKQDVLWTMMDTLWHHFFASECRIPTHPAPSRDPLSTQESLGVFRILGSGAGGGLPQWNRSDVTNDRARYACATQRTQCSAAFSVDGRSWTLINCSPDFREQWNTLLKKYPNASLDNIILTDCQLDHIGGLVSLREGKTLRVYATDAMWHTLMNDTKFVQMLSSYTDLFIIPLRVGQPVCIGGVSMTPYSIEMRQPKFASSPSDVLALDVEGEIFYAPCVSTDALNNTFIDNMQNHPIVLFDGTFLDANEMPQVQGHCPMLTTCQRFRERDVKMPVFTHINNTNPVNRDLCTSASHMSELPIAHDGMEFVFSVTHTPLVE